MSSIELYGKGLHVDPSRTMVDQTTEESLPFLGELLPGDQIELDFPGGKVLIKAEKKKSKKPLKYTVHFRGKIMQKSEIADFTARAIMLTQTEGQDSLFSGAAFPIIQFIMYCKF